MKLLILTLISSFALANGTLSEAVENQCRIEAKEIALKSYQSCVSSKKAEQLNSLRQEYQVRMNELKNEYDQKIKSLVAKPETKNKNKSDSISEPIVKMKKAKQSTKKRSKTKEVFPEPNLINESELTESPSVAVESNTVTGETEKLELEDPSLTTY